MGKASKKKKKVVQVAQAGGTSISGVSKDSVTPQINRALQTPTSKATFLLLIFFILLSSFAVYFNSLSNGFVYDDRFQVKENPWITDARYIPEMFSKNVWSFRKNFGTTNYYRPMMHLVYMMNFHIFGLKPWGFHLINVLFHSGISVLVFLTASRLLRGSRLLTSDSYLAPPFIAALLFATHPIHTEAVTWVAGLPDLSLSFFYLLSFYFYIKSTDSDLPSKGIYALSVTSFFLAALCKEPALTLPILIVLYDYTLKKEKISFTSARKYVPYLVVAGIYFILRFHALGHFAPQQRHAELNAHQYIINIFPLFMQYLEKLILPINLNAFYVLHPLSSLFDARGILSLMITIAFVVLALIAFRKNKLAFLSLLFIIVPLLPALYIPGLGENTFTERYLYLSSFGFVLLLPLLVQWARLRKAASVTIITAILTVIVGLYSWGTVNRNTVWRDNYSLFSDTVRKSPDAKEPHNDLGVDFFDKGQIDEAIEQFQIASSLNSDFIDAHYNLGIAFSKKGWMDKAIEEYHTALRLNPAHSDAYNNLGLAFFNKGWIDKAIEQYQTALRLNPDYGDAYNNLGLAFFNKGWIDRAMEQYQIALKLNPNSAVAHSNLGLAFFNKGWADKAAEEFHIALKLDSNSAVAHNGLGTVLFNKGSLDKAAEEFHIASTLDPTLADAHNNLGVIYKKSGAIDKAINEYQTAIRLNPDNPAYRGNLERAYELKRLSR